MAKKKIDIWATTEFKPTPVANTNEKAADFVGKKDKKGEMSLKDELHSAKPTHQKDERKLKNPLHVVEGKKDVAVDVSTAVSAALSKAIQEDYEIDKLSQILDVVIDEVDDPDLSNESLKRRNFGLVPLFLIICSVIAAIILIPLALMLGLSINKVNDLTGARTILGYRTDADGDATKFSIEHSESGKYLVPPKKDDIVVDATFKTPEGKDDYDPYFYLHVGDRNSIQINRDVASAGKDAELETYSLINNDGNIQWMLSDEAQSGLYLVRKSTNEQEFAIGFDNTNQFVALDEDSDELVLANRPDYFTLRADVDFIESGDEYSSDYKYLTQGTENYVNNLSFGINGNPMSIYSTSSKQYLNSYVNVDEDELPFIEIENATYSNALTLDKASDSNFFLNPVEYYNGSTKDSYLTIGSYQTTAFDWSPLSIIADEDDTETEKVAAKNTWYPLMKYTGNKVEMGQYQNSYLKGDLTDLSGVDVSMQTTIYLLPNPKNLNEKAIYFTQPGKFVTTKGGNIGLEEIDLTRPEATDNIEYFIFSHEERKNPENIVATIGDIDETHASVRVKSDNFSNLLGFNSSLWGYESDNAYSSKLEISQIINDASLTGEEKKAQINEVISGYDTKYNAGYYFSQEDASVEMKRLDTDTWYLGYITVFRDRHVGKHSTSLPVLFKTGENPVDWDGDGAIDIEMPEGGNPTQTGTADNIARIDELVDSTSYENPDSVNVEKTAEESVYDLLEEDMREMGATTIDVTTHLENGSISNGESGVVTGIRVTAYNVESGEEIESKEETTNDVIEGLESGDYTFIFTDLVPQDSMSSSDVYTYEFKLEVQDIEGNWFEAKDPDDGSTTQAPQAFDTERLLPPATTDDIDFVANLAGDANANFEVANMQPTDMVEFRFISQDNPELVATTGEMMITQYESGVTAIGPNGANGVKVSADYYSISESWVISMSGIPTDEKFDLEVIFTMGGSYDYDDWSDSSPLWQIEDSKGNPEPGRLALFQGEVYYKA